MSRRRPIKTIVKYSFQYKMLLYQKRKHLFRPPCIVTLVKHWANTPLRFFLFNEMISLAYECHSHPSVRYEVIQYNITFDLFR